MPLTADWIQGLDDIQMTDRVKALRSSYFDATPEVCPERPLLLTEYHEGHHLFHKDQITPLDKANAYHHVLEKKAWYVHIRAKYPHGRGVMIYLARYLRGGPLKRTQLLRLRNGEVTFRHFDHRSGGIKQMTLSQERFIARLAEHVPEPRQVMVRYGGIWSTGKRAELSQCRSWLGMSAAETPEYLTAAVFLARVGLADRTQCPVCGKVLELVRLKVYGGLPPPCEGQRVAA